MYWGAIISFGGRDQREERLGKLIAARWTTTSGARPDSAFLVFQIEFSGSLGGDRFGNEKRALYAPITIPQISMVGDCTITSEA